MRKFLSVVQNKALVGFAILFLSMNDLFAQPGEHVEMADAFRSNGKIYVVIGVLLIILFGFFAYLIFLNKKLNKILKQEE